MSRDALIRPMLATWLLGAASSALAGPMAGAVRLSCFAWLKCLIAVVVLAANGQCQVNNSSGLQDKIRILEQQGIPTTGETLLKRYHRGTSTTDSHKWSEILEQVKTLQLKGDLNGEIPLFGDEFNVRFVGGFIAGSVWQAGPASVKFSEQHRQLLEQVKVLSASTGAVRLPFEFHGAETELPLGSIETLARMVNRSIEKRLLAAYVHHHKSMKENVTHPKNHLKQIAGNEIKSGLLPSILSVI